MPVLTALRRVFLTSLRGMLSFDRTKVRWSYSETEPCHDPLLVRCDPMDGVAANPLVGLYPHHGCNRYRDHLDYALPSVRVRFAWL